MGPQRRPAPQRVVACSAQQRGMSNEGVGDNGVELAKVAVPEAAPGFSKGDIHDVVHCAASLFNKDGGAETGRLAVTRGPMVRRTTG